jgi:hypothetical protein
MREIDEQYRSHWKLVSVDKYTYKVNLKMLPGVRFPPRTDLPKRAVRCQLVWCFHVFYKLPPA